MEYLIVYGIIAVSFGLMYVLRYGIEIVSVIDMTCKTMDIEMKEHFTPNLYLFMVFCLSTILFPLYLSNTLKPNRYGIISDISANILRDDFGLEDNE